MTLTRRRARVRGLVSFVSGVLFAAGLAMSGMTRTEKVRGFLDFTGAWDPSLAFVMGGAVLVYALAHGVVSRRAAPVLAERFSYTALRAVDGRLIAGSAIFGVGWGLGGFCPGPGVVSLVTGGAPVTAFVVAMLVGLFVTERLAPQSASEPEASPASLPPSGASVKNALG